MPGLRAEGAFVADFPQRFSDAVERATGAIAGIERGAAKLDPVAMAVYHDIYRLKIELELEAAAVLWRAAEAASAMADVNEALRRSMNGGTAWVDPALVDARRSAVPPVWRPMGERRGVDELRADGVALLPPAPELEPAPAGVSAPLSEGGQLLQRLTDQHGLAQSSGRGPFRRLAERRRRWRQLH